MIGNPLAARIPRHPFGFEDSHRHILSYKL
jgi:hypothetical protein